MGYCGGMSLVLLLVIGYSEANMAVPANCRPWKIPVEVDPPNHNHRPFYVEMHRCMGQCTTNPVVSPLQCECVAKTSQDITMNVITLAGYESRTFKNHTSCKSQCKADYKAKCINDGHQWNEPTCTCTCPSSASGTCLQNQFWNAGKCQCECSTSPTSCSTGMFWNKSSCSCQCSVKAFAWCSTRGWPTDLTTCRCRRPKPPIAKGVGKSKSSESETKLVVSLVAIGLLLGTLFIIDLVLMCSKKGFMYGLVTKCSEKKGNQQYINHEAEAETGSITMDLDNNYPVVNENNKHHYITEDTVTNV